MKKVIFSIFLLVGICMSALAQSGTNSPYSQYALGVLSDQSQGYNRGMNGLGIGLRSGNQVNVLNPASYSSIDSLTMIFDLGLSLQLTNFEENGMRKNARNANFEYAVATFRLFPKFGVSAGIIMTFDAVSSVLAHISYTSVCNSFSVFEFNSCMFFVYEDNLFDDVLYE